ncbi:hypothetical protein MBLNU13_g02031t1 [Cladosporium sp. NU13]
MADGLQPTAKASLLQAAQSSDSVPALNKTTTNGATTTDMPMEPETPHSPEQDCPLFKFSTELRLEICRFTIQQALDLVHPPPNTKYRYSAAQTTRGALALLYTCRTLRAESSDAMEPLAKASKSALKSEIYLTEPRVDAAMMTPSDLGAQFIAYLHLDTEFRRLQSNMNEIDGADIMASLEKAGRFTWLDWRQQ